MRGLLLLELISGAGMVSVSPGLVIAAAMALDLDQPAETAAAAAEITAAEGITTGFPWVIKRRLGSLRRLRLWRRPVQDRHVQCRNDLLLIDLIDLIDSHPDR